MDGIKSYNVSISLIREGKPIKLLQCLAEEGFIVSNPYKGIYYVGGKAYFATQIIVARELSGGHHVWLQALTRRLDEQTAKKLVLQAQGCSIYSDKELADSIITVSTKRKD